MQIEKLLDSIRLWAVTQGVPVLLDKDSKAPEAFKIQLLVNNLYIQYLNASEGDKRELLEQIKSQFMTLQLALTDAQSHVDEELNKLNTPLSLAAT